MRLADTSVVTSPSPTAAASRIARGPDADTTSGMPSTPVGTEVDEAQVGHLNLRDRLPAPLAQDRGLAVEQRPHLTQFPLKRGQRTGLWPSSRQPVLPLPMARNVRPGAIRLIVAIAPAVVVGRRRPATATPVPSRMRRVRLAARASVA
jgi:hypothetical protein